MIRLDQPQFLRSTAKDATGQAKGGGCVSGRVKAPLKPPDERVNTSITCDHGNLVSDGCVTLYRVFTSYYNILITFCTVCRGLFELLGVVCVGDGLFLWSSVRKTVWVF